ncbi:MAG: tRNA uridine-5-carboxymethylaminomethyl(34) synthesis GTPase MnmE [Nitrospirae bacterium GWC2_57_13]|jgi:tRNA modification GTPase|nr:MAG: tRNA uridine-5-carboxymethylaminomethyl(34) synthesis GTPase MnmE [Nitrospirae bacterium GWC1_57_7]OGW27359.1 MAG: tRNA uridine-5-carboxymethylaminomethyl(34) synthesis GTPase MnmE [Nitrospirae bacterium GWC2_57_13]OGW41526.1 MAG: tRNA uridine-5-carboxymethylaminomethyl(34) synthesis GTPase MnmE [Nitrospirae bacterium GWD2_57_8]HAS54123.1 tRNA uridine-5-carboxymethylaminomethyl(34) synthesis GTPase MnmE [Nitrospiraceae bacterium]
MLEKDTICAVSTPPGEGGIGIIRISGPEAVVIAQKIFRARIEKTVAGAASHSIRYGHVVDLETSDVVDEVLLTVMRAPATYTKEDIVEINCHGGTLPLSRTLKLLLRAGARQAEPGEFTKRAFLNGRIDLAQAEAVMDIIHARTELSHRAANEQLLGGLSGEVTDLRDRLLSLLAAVEAGIDFPEEDIETGTGKPLSQEIEEVGSGIERLLESFTFGRIVREGFGTAIVGRPNVGKSSLLNALLRQDRAIVTDVPGTTRDVIEEFLNIDGVPIRIIDTAGIRETHDMVEQEGVRRSIAAIEKADIVLVVLDRSAPLHEGDRKVLEQVRAKRSILVLNKADLPRSIDLPDSDERCIDVSCRTGEGLDELRKAISETVREGAGTAGEHAWAVNQRHRTALEQAQSGIEKALGAARAQMSPEFIALDLRASLDSLGLIIGATYTEDILERIFNDFCIGK